MTDTITPKNKKLLVVDDDNLVRNIVAKALRKNGYDVIEAENGHEGLQLITIHNPDLMITDMLMPDMEGLETIMEAKKHVPNLKIIAMSGGGKKQDMMFLNMASGAGANAILEKPFKQNTLLDEVKKLLSQP